MGMVGMAEGILGINSLYKTATVRRRLLDGDC
jgi:hypothetical protein